MKNTLIYDSDCSFCTMVAKKLIKFIGRKNLRIVSNKSPIALGLTISVGINCINIEKDVHFITKDFCSYSKGSAVAHVLALNEKLQFLARWNDSSSIIHYVFNTIYYILKKIKKYYNQYLG